MTTQFSKGHALVIGIGADLPTTVDDAEGLANFLQHPGYCAYPPDQVHLLTSEEATRENILAAFERLAERTSADDTLVVYFSGHGYQVRFSDTPDTWLMAYGYSLHDLHRTAISGQEFAQRLRAIPARRKLILLDCCHAGGLDAADREELKAVADANIARVAMPAQAAELLAEGSGYVFIASSRAEEKSYAGTPYSAFTTALLEALGGRGNDKQDGYVRVTDIAMHCRQVVPERTRNKQVGPQHPVLNFEQADNYRVAFYAGGQSELKALPFSEPQIESTPGALDRERGGERVIFNQQGQQVKYQTVFGDNASVGHIGDNISTGGGDFVGGDKVTNDHRVDTGGGMVVQGNAAAGGDFIGRDRKEGGVHIDGPVSMSGGSMVGGDSKVVHGDEINVKNISGSQGIAIGREARADVRIQHGPSADELTPLFAPLLAQAARENAAAVSQLQALKAEVAKGEEADDDKMADLIGDIAEAAPSVVEGVVNLFTNSVVAKLAGGATKYVLRRLRK